MLYKTLIILFLAGSLNAALPLGEKAQVEALVTTLQAFDSPQREEIWPGFDLRTGTIVHFKNGHAYGFHLRQSPQKWSKRIINKMGVSFIEDSEELGEIPLHPSYQFEREKVFVLGLDPKNDLSLLTLVHERFHLHQFRYFRKGKIGQYTDYRNSENHALMELEHQLLTRFLQSQDPTEKTNALKDYVVVSKTRRSSLSDSSIDWENHQQRMEGLADYASLRTFGVVFDELTDPVLLQMRDKKGRSSLYQDALKGRNYFVGACLGFALDFCDVSDWKEQVAKGSASLQELLERALPIDKSEDRLYAVKKDFDFDTLQEQFRKRLATEQDELNAYKKAFDEQPGQVISVALPKQHTSSGGQRQKSAHFEGMTVSIGDTSTTISEDHQWKLSFTEMPLLFEESNGTRTFKIEEDVHFFIDGAPVSAIRNGLTFSTLSFKSKCSEVVISSPGCLIQQNGMISIEY